MDKSDIPYFRLNAQQIAGTRFTTVQDLVRWMGAIQAQDSSMALWAVGARLPGSTAQTVELALNRGEILRTHVLRPTWHFVAADDIHWLLDLTAPQIKQSLKSRHSQLGLTEAVFSKTNTIIEKALGDRQQLTREQLIDEFRQAHINTKDNCASHYLLMAELDGILCSGAVVNGKQTYTLLRERVVNRQYLSRDEALASLAARYFSSHGPATLPDFTWWSGLSVGEAQHALELVKTYFHAEKIGPTIYWFIENHSIREPDPEAVYLLPAFDEYTISYTERGAVLPATIESQIISSNGIFRPIIVVNGQVAGVWKRKIQSEEVIVEWESFTPIEISLQASFNHALTRFGDFLGKRPVASQVIMGALGDRNQRK